MHGFHGVFPLPQRLFSLQHIPSDLGINLISRKEQIFTAKCRLLQQRAHESNAILAIPTASASRSWIRLLKGSLIQDLHSTNWNEAKAAFLC